MKKKYLISMAIATMTAAHISAQDDGTPVYKDASAPIEQRVEDLLSRMTIEEKVGQMNQLVGLEHMKSNKEMTAAQLAVNTANAFYPGWSFEQIEEMTRQGLVSSFLHVLTLEEANHLQELNMESRLQIPLLIGIDAIHGNAKCQDNTVYPTNIGLACSFDVDMAYKIARQTAAEMRAMNMHWTFNPNVEVARDARWGRCGETFGEDPYLVALMGEATTRGYQGDLDSDSDVIACVKHFVGGSYSINGTNGAPCDVSERTLREVFFPPFEKSIRAGGATVMMSHNELNGIPCHTNKWLMDDVLRGEWGFGGFVVSDWMDIEHCVDQHFTAKDNKEAFRQSIEGGMDMHMHGPEWQQAVVDLVNEGAITEERIDESVRRILYMKFRLGLFENPYVTEERRDRVINDPVHKQTAIEATRNGIVLLKNEGDLLPLATDKYKKILVTGINANDQNIMGDWSELQPDDKVSTVLKGLQEYLGLETGTEQTSFTSGDGVQIAFVDQGWDPRNMSQEKVDEAVSLSKDADLNIVCCGEYMMRFRWEERTSGEDTDRDNLNLVGLQEQLIRRINESGKPTILVIISGRPLSVNYAAENVPAIIEAWEPGQFGGKVIAEIIYGEVNPSAKLAITIPRSSGQVSTWYNHKASAYFHPVVCGDSTPLYPFGYGLSYTTYKYDNLRLATTGATAESDEPLFTATVTITNTGERDGVEIAQLYIRDKVASVARPVKELKDFARVALKAGESKEVTFNITADKLRFLDIDLKPVVEAGEFEIMVGPSSKDSELLKGTVEL